MVSRFPDDMDSPRGGVETATVGLAKALLSKGVSDLHIVTLEKNSKQTQIEHHGNITVHRLERGRWPMVIDVFNGPTARRLRSYITELKPSIVHFHETWGFGAARYSLPTIFTVHGFDSLNLPTEKTKAWQIRQYIWRNAEQRGLRRQNMVISIAPYVRREIEPLCNAPIVDIWNSLDERYFSMKHNEKPNRILFLGWLNPRKNPLVLVEAARMLAPKYQDLSIELCGEHSDPEYLKKLKSLIEQYKLSAVVKLPGRLPQSEVMKRLQQASVLVLPSLQENAPMVIAEAMAAGVPVIASNLCGVPDMIEDGKSGFLTSPHDAANIAELITRLFDDPRYREKISQAAKIQAREKFHPSSVAETTLNAYTQAIARFEAGVPKSTVNYTPK